MRIGQEGWVAAMVGVIIGLSGCGDHNNFLGSLADDTSIEAKIEEAQIALDQGDCETAINGFTSAFNDDPNNVGIRVNLAAAYTCRAGFNVTALIRIGADYVSKGQNDQFNLFKAIADAAANLTSDSWNEDTNDAIRLLTADNVTIIPGSYDCAPYNNDPDAAFNQAIVFAIRAVMAVATLQDLVTGVILTGNIPDVATIVGSALRDADTGISCASNIAGNAVVGTDVAGVISDLNQGLNGLDGNLLNPLTAAELHLYLDDHGFDVQP